MQMRIESSGGEGSCIHRTRELRILKYVENTRREHRLVSSLCHDLHQRYPARDSRNFLTALRRLTFVRGPSPPPPPPAFPYTHILVFVLSPHTSGPFLLKFDSHLAARRDSALLGSHGRPPTPPLSVTAGPRPTPALSSPRR